MENDFEIKIINQNFLSEDITEPCSHGPIYLRVKSTVVSDVDDGDWVINEAALSLMRTVRYGFPNLGVSPPRYYADGISEETLINCCGAFMLFCSSSIRWNVTISEEEVILDKFIKDEHLEYTDLKVELPLKKYAQIIYDFALQSFQFFHGRVITASGWEQFEGQISEFWNEYTEHMEFIKYKFNL